MIRFYIALIISLIASDANSARLFTTPQGQQDGTKQFRTNTQSYPAGWLLLAPDADITAAGVTWQTVDDPNPPLTGILMLGDSITYYGNWPTLLNYTPVTNGGVRSETTSEILIRVPALLASVKPRACFIEGGVNDISLNFTQAQTIANIKSIIALCLASGATPYVQAILPLGAGYSGPAQVNNTNIASLNAAIKAALQTIPGGNYMSFGNTLSGSDWTDGIHLSASGFAKWSASLAPYVDLYR